MHFISTLCLIWHRFLSFCLVPYDKSNLKEDQNKLCEWLSQQHEAWLTWHLSHSCKYRFLMLTVEFNICLSVSCPGSSVKQRWSNNPIRTIRVSGNQRWIDLNHSPANISAVWIIIILIFTKWNLISLKTAPLYYLTFYFPFYLSFMVVINNPTCY